MYVKIGRELESVGVHSICIKDMAGIMSPKEAYELVKALKENVKVPVFLWQHAFHRLWVKKKILQTFF